MAAKQLATSPQDADPGGSEHLVAGEDEEVSAGGVYVHRLVRHGLAGVEQHERADVMSPSRHRRERVDRAEDVRLMGQCHDLGAVGDDARYVREVEPAVVGQAEPAQRRTRATAKLLPGHEIGVVLHLGDDDLVAGADPETLGVGAGGRGVAHRIGHEVDALGGVLDEDDLVGRSADERSDPGAGGLVEVGRLLGKLVRSAVHGRVVPRVELALGVEHLQRLLRRRSGVEIDQRVPVAHGTTQDREVRPDPLDVECSRGVQAARGGHVVAAA